nr:cytochrome c oxidase subunit 2 [Antarctophthirus microchir]
MPSWGQLEFQNSSSPTMSLINSTYDWVMVLVIFVISLVFMVTVRSMTSTSWNLRFEKSEVLETLWSMIPMCMLVLVANPSLSSLYLVDHPSSSPVLLKVLGSQWFWSYETNLWPHPSSSKTSLLKLHTPLQLSIESYVDTTELTQFRLLDVDQTLTLPIDTNVRVLVSSSDVIHSWAIPSMGLKVDAVPGRLNQTFMISTKLGVVYGQCSELCGVMHSMMPIKVSFVPIQTYLSMPMMQG